MFNGFSPETMDFLWGIRMNNERSWFLAHKNAYTQFLYEPMKALGNEIFQPFQSVPGLELKVSRIYRDARMHPATPYKESLWICIRRHVTVWSQHPALFFELRPEGASYGFLLWQPRPDAMERFRQDLSANPHGFPTLLLQTGQALPGSGAVALLFLERMLGGCCRIARRTGTIFPQPSRPSPKCPGGLASHQHLLLPVYRPLAPHFLSSDRLYTMGRETAQIC